MKRSAQPMKPGATAETTGPPDSRRIQLYGKAEAQLRRQKKSRGAPLAEVVKSAADAGRLLHELQVHQVELEMQNAELQESRDRLEVALEKFTDLYDFAPVGYLSVDEQGQILEVNLTGAAMLGAGRSQLLKRRLPTFVAPANRPDFLTFLQRVFTSAEKQVCELSLLRADGSAFWASIHGTTAFSDRSPHKGCRLAVSDITARQQAQDALRASEEQFRALFEVGPVAIYSCDAAGVIQQFNRRAVELWGREPVLGDAKELYCGSSKLFWPDGRRIPRSESPMAEVLSGRTSVIVDAEIIVEQPDGSRRNCIANIHPLKDQSGKITGAINCFYDITDRKLAEEAIRASQALFRALADSISQLAWIAKPDGQVFWYNQRWYDYTGKTPQQMARWGWQAVQAVGELPKMLERWQASIASGEPLEMTFSLRGANGRFRSFLTRVVPLKNARGEVMQWFGTNTDVEDLKQAEAAQRRIEVLAASNQKLEQEIVRRQAVEKSLKQSEQLQTRLLAQSQLMQRQLRQLSRQVFQAQEEERKRISRELHDVIAQTLTGINIRLATLKKETGRNTQDFDRNLTLTQRLVEKSVNLVHDFARELRPAVLDDLGLVPALHSFAKNFTAQTGIHVHLKAFAEVEKLENSRRTVLFRVAQEALTNVARHAQASQVEISIEKLPSGICLKITDNGKSFNVGRALQITSSKRLGLLGMRERLEMVGGSFEIESTPGKGTTVISQIPFHKSARGRALTKSVETQVE